MNLPNHIQPSRLMPAGDCYICKRPTAGPFNILCADCRADCRAEQAKVLEQAVNVRDVWETIPDWMPTPIRLREALEAFAKAVKVMEESCN